MKIGIYNPYFDSYGGGERYMLTAAEHWSKKHTVSVFWDEKTMVAESEKRFSLDLSRIHIMPNVFKNGTLIQKLIASATYDFIFFLSDGSVPSSLARYNMLNFQVPFPHVAMTPWKRTRYQAVICYSEFTKEHLDPTIGIPVKIIYPPIDIDKFEIGKKEKILLSVGRFNSLYSVKKYDVLIEAFKKAVKNKSIKGWKLVIAGGLLDTDKEYFESLKKLAKGYDVEFYPNCSFETLKKLYSTASIYWHAAGFGETDPQHMEHFGITTIEAMASGCVPIVFAGGGQPEIVKQKKNGYLWKTRAELITATERVITNEKEATALRKEAIKSAKHFSKEVFNQAFDALLKSL
ncbi:MAG: glycosyltransferase [Candidatus Gottesmanbacteria bacterium]